MGLNSCVAELAPFAAMVLIEILIIGQATISKAAMSQGLSNFVIVFYSNALATLIILPFCFLFQRTKRPPLSFSILCKFFVCSLIGTTIAQMFGFAGVHYSSPTLASAMRNLIPAFTMLLAVMFRMEKLDLRNSRSQIKILAAVASISGALIVTLYKGPPIGSSSPANIPKSSLQSQNFFSHILAMETNWAIGGIFLATSCLCVSIWIIAQGSILKEYPSQITAMAFFYLFGSLQCGAICLAAERNHPNSWKLWPAINLISVIYCSVLANVVAVYLDLWCIQKKGPLFVAMFKPLGIAIAALMGIIFLGDTLHTGTVMGAVIIVMGFYGVMWVKFKESEERGDCPLPASLQHSSSHKIPLLVNYRDAKSIETREDMETSIY